MELKMIAIRELHYGAGIRPDADERAYLELKSSVAAKGVLFPLVAARRGEDYRVVDGARRLRAVTELGIGEKEELPVLVIDGDDGIALETALIANAVREPLGSLGLAEAVNLLNSKYGRSAADMAAALGKSEVYIRRLLKIFRLPAEVLKSLRAGEITVAHCHWLTKLADKPKMLRDVFQKTVGGDLSHRDLETLVAGYLQGKGSQATDYKFFQPKVVTTVGGSRLRFEPRRNSIRMELNVLHDDIDTVLKEIKAQLRKLAKAGVKRAG